MSPRECAEKWWQLNDFCKNPFVFDRDAFAAKASAITKAQNSFDHMDWTTFNNECHKISTDKLADMICFKATTTNNLTASH